MELRYTISEEQFLNSEKPAVIHQYNRIFLWGCILFCTIFLWYFVAGQDHQTTTIHRPGAPDVTIQQGPSRSFAARNHPLVIVPIFWVLSWPIAVFVYFPRRLRSGYQKDASMQGEILLKLDPASVSLQFTGGSTKVEWAALDHWSEKKGIVWLVYPTRTHHLVSLASLSDPERDQLRSTLAAHLPKK